MKKIREEGEDPSNKKITKTGMIVTCYNYKKAGHNRRSRKASASSLVGVTKSKGKRDASYDLASNNKKK